MFTSDWGKYFRNKEHRQKRFYERAGNYLSYLRKPQRIYWRLISKKLGEMLARTYEIQEVKASIGCDETTGKYVNFKRYFYINFRRIFDLALHKNKPISILDIGSGGGFFLYLARMYGHTVTGMDLSGSTIYDTMIQKFNIPRVIHYLKPSESLPSSPQKYDLITAFAICFHVVEDHFWDKKDWQFFLKDIEENYIKQGGRLHLFFNNEPHGNYEDALKKISQCGYPYKTEHKTINIYF